MPLTISMTVQPDIIVNFFGADGLVSKDGAEVDFFAPQQMRSQLVTTMVLSWKGCACAQNGPFTEDDDECYFLMLYSSEELARKAWRGTDRTAKRGARHTVC
jgi:hypothetical protein